MSEQLEKDFEFVNELLLEERANIVIKALYTNDEFKQCDYQNHRIPNHIVKDMVHEVYRKDSKWLVLFSVEIVWYLMFRCGVAYDDIYLVVGSEYKSYPFPMLKNVLILSSSADVRKVKDWMGAMGISILDNLTVIGNPPYNEGVNTLYDKFIDVAIEMKPKTVCMITPSRWMTNGGKTAGFYNKYISNHSFRTMVHYSNSQDVFPPPTSIKGGVNWFVHERAFTGKCKFNGADRYLDEAVSSLEDSIIKKTRTTENISHMMLSQIPYGFTTNHSVFSDSSYGSHPIYLRQGGERHYRFVDKKLVDQICPKRSVESIDKYKVCVSKANGGSDKHTGLPFILSPDEICTQTFRVLFYSYSLDECKNFVRYMTTKLFQFLFSINKVTQDISPRIFETIPKIDLSKPVDDKMLYEMFSISDEEIEFIEEFIASDKTMRKFFQQPLVKDFDKNIDGAVLSISNGG